MYNSVAFSTFTMLCNHSCYLVSVLFSSPPKGALYPPAVSPHYIPPGLWQLLIYFLFLWISFFWTFHINRMIKYVAFYVWLL